MSTPDPKIALIGIGNILFCDEGLGAYVVNFIKENYTLPENLTLLEGGTLGFSLMTYYQSYEIILIVGTSSKEGEVGTIFVQDTQEVLEESKIRQSANEVEITMMLEICSFHENMGEVELIGMVPKDILSVENGVSQEVLEALPKLVEVLLERLQQRGVVLQPKTSQVSFEKVIEASANPTVDYGVLAR